MIIKKIMSKLTPEVAVNNQFGITAERYELQEDKWRKGEKIRIIVW